MEDVIVQQLNKQRGPVWHDYRKYHSSLTGLYESTNPARQNSTESTSTFQQDCIKQLSLVQQDYTE